MIHGIVEDTTVCLKTEGNNLAPGGISLKRGVAMGVGVMDAV